MTTRSTAAKITRLDTTVEGYTDHDENLLIGGTNYLSSGGYVPSAVERNSTMDPDNQTLVGLIDNDNITKENILNGVYDGARIEVFIVDWLALTTIETILVGILGGVRISGEQYRVEIAEISDELSKSFIETTQLRCRAKLGDSRCQFTLTSTTGTVTAVTTARRVFTDTSRTEANDFFTHGKLTWTSGANNGRTMDIKKYTLGTTTVELWEPMAGDILATDTYNIFQGCDRTFATCRDTFDNTINFRGEPYIQGTTNLVSGNT